MTPYKVLNVSHNANSNTIRQAYLDAVRKHPPEFAPTIFKKINLAYETLKDEDLRIHYELGSKTKTGEAPDSPEDALADFFKADINPTPPTKEHFFTFLKA